MGAPRAARASNPVISETAHASQPWYPTGRRPGHRPAPPAPAPMPAGSGSAPAARARRWARRSASRVGVRAVAGNRPRRTVRLLPDGSAAPTHFDEPTVGFHLRPDAGAKREPIACRADASISSKAVAPDLTADAAARVLIAGATGFPFEARHRATSPGLTGHPGPGPPRKAAICRRSARKGFPLLRPPLGLGDCSP